MMTRNYRSAIIIFIGILLVSLLGYFLITKNTIVEVLKYREFKNELDSFIKNLNKNEFEKAAYQFHFLEAQSIGIEQLKRNLESIKNRFGKIINGSNNITYLKTNNDNISYYAIIRIENPKNDGEVLEIVVYEENGYGKPTITIFNGIEFKDEINLTDWVIMN